MVNINSELLNKLDPQSLELLGNIDRLHVCKYADDAKSAVSEGARLLSISNVDNDIDGDGFRYLIGLEKGRRITSHLSCFFGETSGSELV